MRTRLAIVADSHYHSVSRFAECQRIHHWIADDAGARGCTRWAHAGDVYEHKSNPLERAAAADWVQHMTDAVGAGIIVRGNHDVLGDLPLLGRLDTKGREVHVVEDARIVDLGGLTVACLAWPQRANVHAMLDASVGGEFAEMAAQDALRNVLRGLGDQLRDRPTDVPGIFLGHVMVRGSRVSTGQPLVGCDFELGLEDLAMVGASFYGLGHIHMENAWDVAGAPAVYPGSPRRTSFGELEPKGYLIVEFDGARLVGWERVETPCTPMHHIEDEWGMLSDGQVGWLAGAYGLPASCHGAELRFRYRVRSDEREAARAAALRWRDEWLAGGAVHVKVEEVVIAEQRARAPEIARATTLEEKLEQLWKLKSFDPGDRRDALLAKTRLLEEDSHAA
jgi:exonuclease SbcD